MKKTIIKKALKGTPAIMTENYFGNSYFVIKGKPNHAIDSFLFEDQKDWKESGNAKEVNEKIIARLFEQSKVEPYEGDIIEGEFYDKNLKNKFGKNQKVVKIGDVFVKAEFFNFVLSFVRNYLLIDYPVLSVSKDGSKVFFNFEEKIATICVVKPKK